tara:strand:- start:102 stop:806 length:705 start_codon:yes stop_codon:yes gene_type:complete
MNQSIISIHDIMPHTLDKIKIIIKKLEKVKCSPPTLLVVPGKNWNKNDINFLKTIQKYGYEIAGHGWYHETKNISTIYHKLHSNFISRNVAEHLSLSNKEIIILMNDCLEWFEKNQFQKPITYVPPAWALGKISKKDISNSSYKIIETLSGIYFEGKFKRMPLVGYETDNLFRVITVSFINFLSEKISVYTNTPLRISIHPNDFSYQLKSKLEKILNSDRNFYGYRDYYLKFKE